MQMNDLRIEGIDICWFCYLSFGNAVGAMYVREYFEEDARQSAKSMVKDIRDVFNEILDELEWMDEETRWVTYIHDGVKL